MKMMTTYTKTLLAAAVMLAAWMVPQKAWAESGLWTKEGDTRYHYWSTEDNLYKYAYTWSYSALSTIAKGITDCESFNTKNLSCSYGIKNKALGTYMLNANYKVFFAGNIYSQSKTVPSYTKLVRKSKFRVYMSSDRYRHTAGIWWFDNLKDAEETAVDVTQAQMHPEPTNYIIKKTQYYTFSPEDVTADKEVTCDNSTSSSSKTFTNYITFMHGTHTMHLYESGKSGSEYAEFNETYTDTWYYYATISYNSNGGSGSMSSTSIDNAGTLASSTFTHPSKHFKCWNTKADGSGTSYAAGATFTATASNKGPITLYAIWENHTFNSDGLCTKVSGETHYQPATKNSSGVYEITNKGKMMWFSQNASSYPTSAFALTTDLNMSGLPYISPFYATSLTNLSYDKSDITQKGFEGTFDGRGHVISNMSVAHANGRYSAGIVGNNSGTIKNVIMYNFSYNNNGNFDGRYGAICGVNFGTVENCGVVGSLVKANGKICGAVAGANYGGTVKNSFAKGCTVTANDRAGYLVGDNSNDNSTLMGTIDNCYADGKTLQGDQIGKSCTGESTLTATRFASGEICYKLNGSVSGGSTWFQAINSNDYPVLTKTGSNTVYYGYLNCGSNSMSYSNASVYSTPPQHGTISGYEPIYTDWEGKPETARCRCYLKCNACSKQFDIKYLSATEKNYGYLKEVAVVIATCDKDGSYTLRAVCETGNNFSTYFPSWSNYEDTSKDSEKNTHVYTIPKTGHAINSVTWKWSNKDGVVEATASGTCMLDATHAVSVTATVENGGITSAPDANHKPGCTEMGQTTYTAKIKINECEFTDTHNFADIPYQHSFTDDCNGFCVLCGNGFQPLDDAVDGWYEIANAGQLYSFAEMVNSGTNPKAQGRLTHNIVVNEGTFNAEGKWNQTGTPRAWVPIGSETVKFKGAFNGNGYSISGLYCNTNNNNVGFVGYAEGAGIQHTGIEKCFIHGGEYVGGLCGQANGTTIETCYTLGEVNGNDNVGGICGYCFTEAPVSNCYSAANVSGKTTGGICGGQWSSSPITNCYTTHAALSGSSISNVNSEANVPTSRFSSGEIAYKLSCSKTDGKQMWYQTIHNDAFPSFSGMTVYYDEEHTRYYNTSTITGDVYPNYKLNIADIASLIEILNGRKSKVTVADLNNDSKVDIKDFLILRKYILGYMGQNTETLPDNSDGAEHDDDGFIYAGAKKQ